MMQTTQVGHIQMSCFENKKMGLIKVVMGYFCKKNPLCIWLVEHE